VDLRDDVSVLEASSVNSRIRSFGHNAGDWGGLMFVAAADLDLTQARDLLAVRLWGALAAANPDVERWLGNPETSVSASTRNHSTTGGPSGGWRVLTAHLLTLSGDVVEHGALRQAIQNQGKEFFYFGHTSNWNPLGRAKISDSPAGLTVNGSLLLSDPAAQRAYEHLKMGSMRGLSIGYQVDAANVS
jgi:hypothetical protein